MACAGTTRKTRGFLLTYFVRSGIFAEPDVSVDAKDLVGIVSLCTFGLGAQAASSSCVSVIATYHILERQLWDSIVGFDQFLCHIFNEGGPVFLRLSIIRVVHYDRSVSADVGEAVALMRGMVCSCKVQLHFMQSLAHRIMGRWGNRDAPARSMIHWLFAMCQNQEACGYCCCSWDLEMQWDVTLQRHSTETSYTFQPVLVRTKLLSKFCDMTYCKNLESTNRLWFSPMQEHQYSRGNLSLLQCSFVDGAANSLQMLHS